VKVVAVIAEDTNAVGTDGAVTSDEVSV